jgi:hypothetical protein
MFKRAKNIVGEPEFHPLGGMAGRSWKLEAIRRCATRSAHPAADALLGAINTLDADPEAARLRATDRRYRRSSTEFFKRSWSTARRRCSKEPQVLAAAASVLVYRRRSFQAGLARGRARRFFPGEINKCPSSSTFLAVARPKATKT